jgi:putative tryptophan/tyrosine transport system substrate-binding protein
MRRIGVLMGWPESDPEARSELAAFVQELQKLGWADGRNLRIDTRWAAPADPESMHRFAKGLVALHPDLILSQSTPATAALLQKTRPPERVVRSCSPAAENLHKTRHDAAFNRYRRI